MIGIALDCILMLLLVAALAYGVRLEKKLRTLREGQLAFAGAVSELNTAAGRAEAALASLRASGQETDLLHDRIVKARAVKAELETLIARGGDLSSARSVDGRPAPAGSGGDGSNRAPDPSIPALTLASLPPSSARRETPDLDPMPANQGAAPSLVDERARRMAALADRVQGIVASSPVTPAAADRVAPILQALAANQSAKQSLNRARRSLDEDLFAA